MNSPYDEYGAFTDKEMMRPTKDPEPDVVLLFAKGLFATAAALALLLVALCCLDTN